MWNLTPDHCCATCIHPTTERINGQTEYNCPIQLDALDPNLALAVYVEPLARCSCYECDELRFYQVHGWHIQATEIIHKNS